MNPSSICRYYSVSLDSWECFFFQKVRKSHRGQVICALTCFNSKTIQVLRLNLLWKTTPNILVPIDPLGPITPTLYEDQSESIVIQIILHNIKYVTQDIIFF
jgi:hypothetical protein